MPSDDILDAPEGSEKWKEGIRQATGELEPGLGLEMSPEMEERVTREEDEWFATEGDVGFGGLIHLFDDFKEE